MIIPTKIRDSFQRKLEPSDKKLIPVSEPTIYPVQFPILLREQMQGKTVLEVAEILGVTPEQVIRLLAGQWRPSKDVCRRMGLKIVYAISGSQLAAKK